MRHRWIFSAVMVAALAAAVQARPGLVLTKDSTLFEGDVTENRQQGTVDIIAKGITTTVKLANVQSIVYPEVVSAEVRQQVLRLKKDDVQGRIVLAQRAIDSHAYEAARDILQEASATDPANAEVRGMLENVQHKLHPTAVAETPATGPAPATVPVAELPPRAGHGGTPPVPKRTVTPEEIGRIKQLELGKDDTNVRVKIDTDVRKRYLAYSGMALNEFNSRSAVEQAFLLIEAGRDFPKGVHILSDPATIAVFRKETNKVLIAGCATTGCHGTKPVGNFVLFPQGDSDAAVYSNFLILQRFTLKLPDRLHSMVDRLHPRDSLLLDFILDPQASHVPHPEHTGYKGAVRNSQEVRYKQVESWLDVLSLPGPDYTQFDLSKPPTTQPTATAEKRGEF